MNLMIRIAAFSLVGAISLAEARLYTDASITDPSETSLQELRTEVFDLKRKVDKPPKDAWDKLSTISGLLSGIVVALIGFYATNVYNRRQKAWESCRRDQELAIAQIQTAEKFMPYLSSGSEPTKRAALVAIAALGNEDLAVKLARAFAGPGATSALTTIASTAGPGAAKAERALSEVVNYSKKSVVALHGERSRATAVVTSPDEVLTTAHAVRSLGTNIEIGLPDDILVRAELVAIDDQRDLALLRLTQPTDQAIPIDLNVSEPRLGERLIALLVDPDGSLRVELGEIKGIEARSISAGGTVNRIRVRLSVKPGDGGAPVLDAEGRLLGLVQAALSEAQTTILIPASEALRFVTDYAALSSDQHV